MFEKATKFDINGIRYRYHSEISQHIGFVYKFYLEETRITVLVFTQLQSGLCSVIQLQNMAFFGGHITHIKNVLEYFSLSLVSGTVLTIQNVTKEYNLYLKIGFIDTYRLPGSYTSHGTSGAIQESVDACMSIFVYPKNNRCLKSAAKASLKTINHILESK